MCKKVFTMCKFSGKKEYICGVRMRTDGSYFDRMPVQIHCPDSIKPACYLRIPGKQAFFCACRFRVGRGLTTTCLGPGIVEEPGKEDCQRTSRATAVEDGKPAGAATRRRHNRPDCRPWNRKLRRPEVRRGREGGERPFPLIRLTRPAGPCERREGQTASRSARAQKKRKIWE